MKHAIQHLIEGQHLAEAEAARDGLSITVSYWDSLASIAEWKRNFEHLAARLRGQDD